MDSCYRPKPDAFFHFCMYGPVIWYYRLLCLMRLPKKSTKKFASGSFGAKTAFFHLKINKHQLEKKNLFPIDAPALHTDVFFIVPSRINHSNSKEVNILLFLPSFCKRFSKWIGFLDDRSSLLHFNCVYIRGEFFSPSSTFFCCFALAASQ